MPFSQIFILIALILLAVETSAADFLLVNADGGFEGLNDNTPTSPVGGNHGATLGQQRKILMEAVFQYIGGIIESDVTIEVQVSFDPLECDQASGLLGGAAPFNVMWNFPGAPEQDLLYPSALANVIAGQDLAPGEPDIEVIFNSDIDFNNNCLYRTNLYYGLDGADVPGTINMQLVALHELMHGLGFLTFVSADGTRLFDLNDQYTQYLYDADTELFWSQMSNAERAASHTGRVVWRGPETVHRARNIYQYKIKVGTHGTGNSTVDLVAPMVYTPDQIEPESSISHWEHWMSPRQLMEPFADEVITEFSELDLSFLFDIGFPVSLPIMDTDGDGVHDRFDLYPTDPSEWANNDGDIYGDNVDWDDDNDEMSDEWELAFSTDPFVADANVDKDGDGWTNQQEYLARSNPSDSNSTPLSFTGYLETFVSSSLPAQWRPKDVNHPVSFHVENGRLTGSAPIEYGYNNPDFYYYEFGALFEAESLIVFDTLFESDICNSSFAKVTDASGNITDSVSINENVGYEPNTVHRAWLEVGEGLGVITFSGMQSCHFDSEVWFDNVLITTRSSDFDNDGANDGVEVDNGLDPRNPNDASADNDDDGLTNIDEVYLGTDFNNPDSDYDGLDDGDEVVVYATNPLAADTDADQIADDWEVKNGTDPLSNDAMLDFDGDNYSNLEEYFANTDPYSDLSLPLFLGEYQQSFEQSDYIAHWLSDDGFDKFSPNSQVAISGVNALVSSKTRPSHSDLVGDFEPGTLSFFAMIDSPAGVLGIEVDGIFQSAFAQGDSVWQSGQIVMEPGVQVVRFNNYGSCLDSNALPCRLARIRGNASPPSRVRIDAIQFVPYALDEDLDGISDAYEIEYGLDELYDDSSFDNDADGYTNLEEFLVGTDPLDEWNFPRIYYHSPNDFNVDLTSDVLLRSDDSGSWRAFRVEAGLPVSDSGMNIYMDKRWKAVAKADFDGDGDADILLRNESSGGWHVFFVEDFAIQSHVSANLYVNPEWELVAANDFDADGDADVLLRKTGNASIYMPYRLFIFEQGTVVESIRFPIWNKNIWAFQGAGDFNKDGKADVLVRNTINGSWRSFVMGEGGVVSNARLGIFAHEDWQFVGIGDFDGDGDGDVLIRKSGGGWQNFVIEENAVVEHIPLNLYADANFLFQAANDYDGDGDTDVLLRDMGDGATMPYTLFSLEAGEVVDNSEFNLWADVLWKLQ